MKHFMLPRNPVLREASPNPSADSPTPPPPSSHKSKPNLSPSPSVPPRRHKFSNENAPPPSDLHSSPSPASKIRTHLPPKPPSSNPLKRKLAMDAAHDSSPHDSGVQVIVRMRPLGKDDEGDMTVQKLSNDSLCINGHNFRFDSVADIEATQQEIFQLIGSPLVENCLAGFNSSVFAYGQTGSGKTYTIWGPSNVMSEVGSSSDQQGLTPRVFERLFARIKEASYSLFSEQVKHADRQLTYKCRCSFLEIYNEQITDLLDPSQGNLQIREDVKSGVYVENLTEEYVFTLKDVNRLLIKGLSNRRTGATSVNAESSRSHSVFTCIVESRCKSMADGISSLKTSRINLVDLAGSERQKSTGAAGERLKEAGNINRSLSQLGNLINILAEVSQTGKQRHIPYRDSKLTFLLQESLGGNAKLAMVCAISPAQSCKSETFSTLRFAQRAKAIKNKAVVNEEMEDDVNHLREVIQQLRDELHRVKANKTNPTGWDPHKSLNILKSLMHPHSLLTKLDEDGDEEMEIDEEAVEKFCAASENQALKSSRRVTEQGAEDNDVDMEEGTPEKVEDKDIVIGGNTTKRVRASTDQLAASIHRGLEIMDSHPRSSAFRRSAFRFSYVPAENKQSPIIEKHDVGVQTISQDDDQLDFICKICKGKAELEQLNGVDYSSNLPLVPVDDSGSAEKSTMQVPKAVEKVLELNGIDENSNLQLVPVDGSGSAEKSKIQVPKAVEKVLAGAIRREMALEEFCAKKNSEIMQLKRLVQQYKHERECNAVISETKEDKILRLEGLMDGVLPTEEFVEEEYASLIHEHKLLKEKYDNHPEVLRVNIELKRAQEELENYRNFCDLGEREVLLEEIQDLRNQLQYYVDSSSAASNKRRSLLQLTYLNEQPALAPPDLSTIPESSEDGAEEKLEQERLRWTEAESKWISLAEELRAELDAARNLANKQAKELEIEKNCAEELKEAMQMAMEGHARMLEQHADLEVKHIQLLARHRKIQEGIEDVKKAAARAGVKGAESKFINALAAEISALRVEREKERRYYREEIRGLEAQLRDTANAVQAAGELLVRLREAEQAVAVAQERALRAEAESGNALKKLKRKHEDEIETLKMVMAESRLPKEAIPPPPSASGYYGEGLTAAKYDEGEEEEWRDEMDASSWFSGYDRCNI
ncbi:Kinesin-like protein KIN-12A [Linum grandiflorum]